ncbi:MAG: glycerol-3-phosphate 1-O-acyltransferase PlsY [Alphaproteobacteria bacterium]|nr:glycerol-3-phosphate 1-O-acyltransferase PlsY [Alphaproteobacteria bacterium]
MITSISVSALIGYFCGSVPFGLVLTYLAGLGDIRKIGSGNIGTTNVLRTGHKGLALLTLLLDVFKAAFAAVICEFLFNSTGLGFFAGFMAVIGHNFPVWLKFKGGKGVASTLGLMLAMSPVVGIFTCLTWLVVALIWHYSSLAALLALTAAPVCALLLHNEPAALTYSALCLLSYYRHRSNIRRLSEGIESKISFHQRAV